MGLKSLLAINAQSRPAQMRATMSRLMFLRITRTAQITHLPEYGDGRIAGQARVNLNVNSAIRALFAALGIPLPGNVLDIDFEVELLETDFLGNTTLRLSVTIRNANGQGASTSFSGDFWTDRIPASTWADVTTAAFFYNNTFDIAFSFANGVITIPTPRGTIQANLT